jgi:YD repeat-containing protein
MDGRKDVRMESLHSEVVRGHVLGFGLSKRSRWGRQLLILALWLLSSVTLWVGAAQAQSTSYVYDANGRVVAVTSSTGTSVQYSYDTLGHVSQVGAPLSPGQLAIFAFMPTHGEPGAQVTIQGQGFDSNPANDTVSFNGAVATVLSATATQLVATVPSGATTGPISVTADGQTATSSASFVIDDTGLPPSITQVSPAVVSVGGTVTVTGTHLDPISGNTTLQMGAFDVPLSSVADTQLQYAVPTDGTSGYVTVETPYGSATSPSPVIVLPSSFSTSSVVSSGNATINGAGVALNIASSGQVGAVTFAGAKGAWISLQGSAITTTASSISYSIYAPGNVLVQQGSVSATSPSIHLPQLTANGTYLALFQPSGAGAQMTVGVATDAQLTANVAATVVTSVPGQSARMLFNASAGQNFLFEINGTTTTPSNQNVTYTIYTPTGATYTSTATSTTGMVNLGNLPTSGTYQIIVAPGSGVTGSMQVEVAQGVGGALSNASQSYATSVPGQNAYLSFTATQNENLELTFNNINVTGGSPDSLYVYVYGPTGQQAYAFTCSGTNPGNSCTQHLWYLTAGTYSVVVTPYNTGAISFSALLQDDLVGPTVATGGTANISLGTGQVERLTFNANAGDTIALNVSGITTTPAGQSVNFSVYSPSVGAAITTSTAAYTTFSGGGGQTVNLSNLPVSGTYTVIVSPNNGLPANLQFSVLAGETGTMASNGASQSYGTSVAGQNAYLSFTATQNENLELTFNNINVTGGSPNSLYVYVYDPTGAQAYAFTCSGTNPGNSCTQHLWYLMAGTYSVVVTPYSTGAISFSALLQDDVIGPTVAKGGTANINLGAGQVERLTFNANAGDTVALNVAGFTTTPSGQSVNFSVYSPSVGTAITTSTTTYTTFSGSGGQTVNLSNLPVSGTYTVIVSPNNGVPSSLQFSVVGGVTGTLSSGGAAQSYTANVANQNAYMTFTATANENLELTLNNINVTGGGSSQLDVVVYNATGSQVASFNCSGSTSNGSSCSQSLWYMPAGTYSVLVEPNNGGTMSFNALLQDDLIGPTVADGGTANISLGAGQVERLTFNANAGDTLALNVAGLTTTPSGQSVNFAVYSPSVGTAITTSTATYTTFSGSGGQTVNLSNLPVSGTYTVIVSPNYGLPANLQFSVVGGVTGTLRTGGATQSYTANVTGENAYMTFTATANENLELTLNNINVTGGGSGVLSVFVFNATGSQVTSFDCSESTSNGSSCSQSLWYMPAGTYSVLVESYNGGTMSFHALLQDDLIGPTVADGGTANVSLGAGQVERLTFNANAGDTVALNVAGVTTTPSGQSVTFAVYSPSVGTAITTSTAPYATFNGSGGQTVNLSNLPVSGTYTVIVSPNNGLPTNLQFTLASDTSGSGPSYGTPTLSSNGTASSQSTTTPGQPLTMTFNANAGDNLELLLSNVSITGSGNYYVSVNVYNPAGTSIKSGTCFVESGPGCDLSLWNLQAGTYSVTVTPQSSSAEMSFSAVLQPDVIGPALTTNTPQAINLGAGQTERLTFNANAGDTVALQLSGVSTTPSGQYMYALVYSPGMGAITASNYYTVLSTNGSNTLNLPNLPETGTYTVVVYTANSGWGSASYSGVPGSAQLTVFGNNPGTLSEGGAAQSFAASAPGQNSYFTFNANTGDNLELMLSNVITTGSGNYYVSVNVYNAAGINIKSGNCLVESGPGCLIPLWNLPAGTYSVIVTPPTSSAISFNAVLQPDLIGPALTTGTPQAVSFGAGQAERVTFNASAGQTIALQLSNVATTPSGQYVYALVYRPDTGAITTSNYYTVLSANGSNTLNLPDLPVSGAYTVVLYGANGSWGNASYSGVAGSAQLTVYGNNANTLSESGATQSFTASAPGQNSYFTFNANAGDNLELTLSNVVATGSGNYYVSVNVYNAAGVGIKSGTCFVESGPGCNLSLWNLQAGTYSVIVTPPSNTSAMSFSALLEPDLIGPTLTAGTPQAVSFGTGQAERVTFNATAGQTVALQLSNVATTPSGQNVYALVYRPDTGAITTSNYYTTLNSNGSTTLNLPDLPASGTYTVVVYAGNASYSGLPGSAQLTVYGNNPDTLSEGGTTQSFTASAPGQNSYFTFNANAGDNLELMLSNVSVTGAGNNDVSVNVYNAAGVGIKSGACFVESGPSCDLSLWNLPAGTYSVIVTPPSNSAMSFNAVLQPDLIGPAFTSLSPQTVSFGAGQAERVTFNATAGQTIALQLSNVSTTPSGQYVYALVYRPDLGAITTSNYYSVISANGSSTVNLPNLPATGTYTVVLYGANAAWGSAAYTGVPGSAQLTLMPSTLLATGAPEGFAAAGSGQSVLLKFGATAGQNLELTLSNINASGASTNGFEVLVNDPNGLQVANFYCYASSPGSSCTQPLWNLLAGTYSISAIPIFGGTISFQAQLQPDLSGPALTSGAASSISLAAGQAERVTFNATQGSNLVLQLADVSTTPANQDIYVDVYRPDVGEIETIDAYTSFEATGANSLSLNNLPAGGTYTAVIRTGTGIPASAQLSYTTP